MAEQDRQQDGDSKQINFNCPRHHDSRLALHPTRSSVKIREQNDRSAMIATIVISGYHNYQRGVRGQ